MFSQLLLLIIKDIRMDWRRTENLPAIALFTLLIWLIFALAFHSQNTQTFRTTPLVTKRASLIGATPQQLQILKSIEGQTHSHAQGWVNAFNLAAKAYQTPFHPPLDRATLLKWSQHSTLQSSAAALLWVVLLLSGILGINRSFSFERQHNAWHALLLTPVPRQTLWLAKCLANFLALSTIMLLALLASALFLQLPLAITAPQLIPILACGTLGFSALGSLLACLTTSLPAKELLLPLLLYPLLIPLILAGVQATSLTLDGYPISQLQPWLHILLACDILFLLAGFSLAKHAFSS